MTNDCIFCRIVAGEAPATIEYETPNSLTIIPLNPVADRHTITLPRVHVRDALEAKDITALAMTDACTYAAFKGYQHVNIITSVGMLATQSVRHLHIHVVPRHPHDGLVLPWGDNERQSREYRENAYRFYSGEGGTEKVRSENGL